MDMVLQQSRAFVVIRPPRTAVELSVPISRVLDSHFTNLVGLRGLSSDRAICQEL